MATLKGQCPFCEGEASIAAYRAEDVTLEEIEGVLLLVKMCNDDARELEAIYSELEKKEIAKTVA